MHREFERYAKKTRRALCLEETEQVVPWIQSCRLIEPQYPNAGSGRPSVGWSGCCGFTFSSNGSTCQTQGWKRRCTTRL